mmetsp:Transcript_6674/g.13905  ORF Transcript_6674/g.13905 Transcript_6674/m.13905 type:complete len:299 (+) Transcript_6674:143-1039(+)
MTSILSPAEKASSSESSGTLSKSAVTMFAPPAAFLGGGGGAAFLGRAGGADFLGRGGGPPPPPREPPPPPLVGRAGGPPPRLGGAGGPVRWPSVGCLKDLSELLSSVVALTLFGGRGGPRPAVFGAEEAPAVSFMMTSRALARAAADFWSCSSRSLLRSPGVDFPTTMLATWRTPTLATGASAGLGPPVRIMFCTEERTCAILSGGKLLQAETRRLYDCSKSSIWQAATVTTIISIASSRAILAFSSSPFTREFWASYSLLAFSSLTFSLACSCCASAFFSGVLAFWAFFWTAPYLLL